MVMIHKRTKHQVLELDVYRSADSKNIVEKTEGHEVTLKMHDLKMTDKQNYGSGKCKSGK